MSENTLLAIAVVAVFVTLIAFLIFLASVTP